MKIRFYPLKRNGEIAKPPLYVDALTKEFCCYNILNIGGDQYRYSYSSEKSLYEVYMEIRNVEIDLTDQMFVEKTPISIEKIKEVLKAKTIHFLNWNIFPKIIGFEKRMNELSTLHRANIDNIHYCAFNMEKNIGEYKGLYNKTQHLKKGELVYLKNPEVENENYHHYINIIDDITPVIPEELV